MARKRKTPYVDRVEMYAEIGQFYDTGDISERLHMIFWKMSNHIINMARFNRYTPEWKEDMISSAYIKCLNIVSAGKYDMERSNPFSYFTTVIRNCFKDHCVSEKKQKKIRQRLGDMAGITDCATAKSSAQ